MNPHYLKFWGSITNTTLIKKEFPTSDLWFETEALRSEAKRRIEEIAKITGEFAAFSDGYDPLHQRTIARMTMVLPDGSSYPYEYDFGYCYPVHSAEFMFTEGNYSCDCNKSAFLSETYPEVKEFDCGDTIELRDFTVELTLDS